MKLHVPTEKESHSSALPDLQTYYTARQLLNLLRFVKSAAETLMNGEEVPTSRLAE